MADNYQTTTTTASVALAKNLAAPTSFVDGIIKDLPSGSTVIASISPPSLQAQALHALSVSSSAPTTPDVTALIAGANLAYVNYGVTGAHINLNALTTSQQGGVAGIIYGPATNGGAATGSFTVNYSNTSTNPATAFHGSIMVGTGNNLLNINAAQAFSVNAPDAQVVGSLTQNGLKGAWNNIFNLSGRGDETVSLGSGANFVSTGSGTNHVDLLGTQTQSNSTGVPNYDLIQGGSGADVVTSGANFRGYANVDGGAGSNSLVVDGAMLGASLSKGIITVSLQNGGKIDVKNIQDFIFGDAAGGPQPTINLGNFTKSLSLVAGAGNYTISTGKGSDSVTVGSGNDSIATGNGNDSVIVGSGNDSIITGNGNDSVLLGGGVDSVITGNGNDSVFTSGGNDTLLLGSGNDLLTLGTGFVGSVIVDGGAGKNTLDLSFVSIQQATQASKNGPVDITLSNGSTVDVQHIQQFIYSDANSGQVVTVGVAELLQIFGHV